jgi:diaminohydroxyphosphoribosylaminopyrimidine deaminase/5-amino-6-(5-phosphoribosylamino)uracil reductase
MALDRFYLHQACLLAMENEGNTSPNPPVGALVVRDGLVVSRGTHARAGGPHAEAIALAAAGKEASGATLYCSLEPCAHFGKTPPCTDAITAAGIRRVVYGIRDRNPVVNGKGEQTLLSRGIDTEQIRMKFVDDFYFPFFRTVELGRPFIVAKAAVTANGIIAPSDRNSQWITNEVSRLWVHNQRAVCDAIVVGADTVVLDRPALTVRETGTGRRPLRIVLDSRFKLAPDDFSLLDAPGPILVCGAATAPEGRERVWEAAGVATLRFSDTADLVRQWMNLGLRRVLLEGGQRIYTMFQTTGLIDEYVLMIAPRLLTGSRFLNLLSGPEQSLAEAPRFPVALPLDLDGDLLLRMRKPAAENSVGFGLRNAD